MVKTFCDRCEKEIYGRSEKVKYVNYVNSIIKDPESKETYIDTEKEYIEVDLCSSCNEQLHDFMNGALLLKSD